MSGTKHEQKVEALMSAAYEKGVRDWTGRFSLSDFLSYYYRREDLEGLIEVAENGELSDLWNWSLEPEDDEEKEDLLYELGVEKLGVRLTGGEEDEIIGEYVFGGLCGIEWDIVKRANEELATILEEERLAELEEDDDEGLEGEDHERN